MSDKRDLAIKRIRAAAESNPTGKPIMVCYSGGKDSEVVLKLFMESGVDFEVQHSHTTVDAPETVYTVRRVFKALEDDGIKAWIDYPRESMWKLIPRKMMPPTRLVRYCCDELKEQHGRDRFIATGVRKDESRKRANRDAIDVVAKKKENREHISSDVFLSNDNTENRRLFETCIKKGTLCVNPIIDWTDQEVMDFYTGECRFHNPLYADGCNRVGCIGCPMGGLSRYREFARYPTYRAAYIRSFDKMIENRITHGKETQWRNGEEVMHWWLEDGVIPGQMEMFEEQGGYDA